MNESTKTTNLSKVTTPANEKTKRLPAVIETEVVVSPSKARNPVGKFYSKSSRIPA
jgi:hypothetical protein